MAHFYAKIQGNRGAASRLGSKQSGIGGTISGWNAGVRVDGAIEETTDADEFSIIGTSGSSGRGTSVYIGLFSEKRGFVLSEDIRKEIEKEIREEIRKELLGPSQDVPGTVAAGELIIERAGGYDDRC